MSPVHIRLLTYNIHKGFNITNRRFVLHQIRDILRSTGVDLAFLQEIQGEHAIHQSVVTGWPEESQYEFLADEVWSHYAYGKNAIYTSGHHGNAILSKHPFIEWENLNVSRLKMASRSLLHGVVDIPPLQRSLHVICIHLDMIGMERSRQVRLLAQRIREKVPADEPLIVAGDFNAWTNKISNYLYTESGLEEVHHAAHGHHARTYPSRWPLFALDRIYYRNIDLVDCRCLNQHPWRALSDHMPLYAEFRLDSSSVCAPAGAAIIE